MLKLILIAALAVCTLPVSAKRKHKAIEVADSTFSILDNDGFNKRFAGTQYYYNTTTKRFWHGFDSFNDLSRVNPTVNIYATMNFSSEYNLVTITVRTVPLGTSAPEQASLANIYTNTCRYEVVNNQLVINKFIIFNISPDYKVLTSAANAGEAFPYKFIKK